MGPKRSGVQAHVCPSPRPSGSFTGSSPLPQTATQPGVSLLGLWEELDLSGRPFLCPQLEDQGQSRGQVKDAFRPLPRPPASSLPSLPGRRLLDVLGSHRRLDERLSEKSSAARTRSFRAVIMSSMITAHHPLFIKLSLSAPQGQLCLSSQSPLRWALSSPPC